MPPQPHCLPQNPSCWTMLPPHPPPPPGCLHRIPAGGLHCAGVGEERGCKRGAVADSDATTSLLGCQREDSRWAVGLLSREEDSGARLGLG